MQKFKGMQERPGRDPPALVDQEAMHQRDLTGRTAE
jgi:hypothetical protein